jgi:hypothetical protein
LAFAFTANVARGVQTVSDPGSPVVGTSTSALIKADAVAPTDVSETGVPSPLANPVVPGDVVFCEGATIASCSDISKWTDALSFGPDFINATQSVILFSAADDSDSQTQGCTPHEALFTDEFASTNCHLIAPGHLSNNVKFVLETACATTYVATNSAGASNTYIVHSDSEQPCNTVPEPPAFALLGVAIVALIVVRLITGRKPPGLAR